MQSQLTSFEYKILSIENGRGEKMDNMIDIVSKTIKNMNGSNSWDMELGEERTLCL